MSKKKITLITGQDYSYLNVLLLEKGGESNISEKTDLDEEGKRLDMGEVVVKIDPKHFSPTEDEQLLGDASKARKKLNCKPSIFLSELIAEIIKEDLNEAKKDYLLKIKGFSMFGSKE